MATQPGILFFFPTPVFLLGTSHGQRSLAGYSHTTHTTNATTLSRARPPATCSPDPNQYCLIS